MGFSFNPITGQLDLVGNTSPVLKMPVTNTSVSMNISSTGGTTNANASGGAIQLYLPAISAVPVGALFTVKKVDSSANTVSIYGGFFAYTIDGSYGGYMLTLQYQSVIFQSDGSNYNVVAGNLDTLTKSYVDGLASGLSIKASVAVSSTAALPTNNYSNGSSGVGATLVAVLGGVLVMDGQTVNVNDRVLVKDEATASHNGIYICTNPGTVGIGGTPYTLTRSTDLNTPSELPGAFTFIETGTKNAGFGYVIASRGPFTIGTTAINWTIFSSAKPVAPDQTLVATTAPGYGAAIVSYAFTTLIPFTTVRDLNGNYNSSTGYYTVPVNGTYLIVSKLRFSDGLTSGISFGQGVDTGNSDTPAFAWFVTNPQRNGSINTRIASFTAGNQLRMFYYFDGSVTGYILTAELDIYLLG